MTARHTPTWLVLAYQLPPRPSHLRVRIWRRLQQLGAAVLRNSIYVLPLSAEAREDFEWVRSEIVSHKGQASLLEASAIDGYTDTELANQFRTAREGEYQEIAATARRISKLWSSTRRRVAKSQQIRTLRLLRERLTGIVERDHFQAPGRDAAAAAVNALQRQFDGDKDPLSPTDAPQLAAKDFRHRLWITRPRPGIDRMASAWLIRRFVAPSARFSFSSRVPGGRSRAVPFDMAGVDFGHHADRCTFETLVARFAVLDQAVQEIAQIVHDLDLKETRYGRPEGLAIGRIVEGLRAMTHDDAELLERGILVIEALYRSLSTNGTTHPTRITKGRSAR